MIGVPVTIVPPAIKYNSSLSRLWFCNQEEAICFIGEGPMDSIQVKAVNDHSTNPLAQACVIILFHHNADVDARLFAL